MEKPDIDLETISLGKIFQISPEGNTPIQVKYGGDFVVATEYLDQGVQGYIANVYDQGPMVRIHGVSFVRVPWELVECVGAAQWFRKDKREEENGESKMH